MDGSEFDRDGAIPAVPTPITPSRRGAVGAALAAAVGALASWLTRSPEAAANRRNACQVRCGADRRICRKDCRDWGDAEKPCKRACNKLRDACFVRCDFRPIRFRLARG
jgi:hypothetical protein